MNPVILQKFAYRIKKLPILPKFITLIIRLIYGCYLPHNLKIGKNLVLGYGGIGVVIHERAIIGDNVHVSQNVTIGGTTKKTNVPIIGNFVYIGAGAVILGPVNIGDNVVIGANAVVTKDIPANSLAVGVPAKVIKNDIRKSDYV